jgi:hypothetical protein
VLRRHLLYPLSYGGWTVAAAVDLAGDKDRALRMCGRLLLLLNTMCRFGEAV